ncbi:MAG: methionine--tRNA ligase [Patescibacteria group bacterium]|jgi:methionyl-tRNA synthetase|nr:methionine--tRNA ligase [Patescibacteria group bacterium]
MLKKIYITTAIPYSNADPHLGHVLEFIQADCAVRYQRLKGNEVYFLTGVDENSLKNALAAEKEGISPKELVDKKAQVFKDILKLYNISISDFIRTTEKRHFEGVNRFWKAAEKDIYQSEYQGLYCTGCEDYLKEEELIDGLCPNHKQPPQLISEKNYFFKLSGYQQKLKEIYQDNQIEIVPETRKAEIENFIGGGLKDFSISRSKERAHNWGIITPNDDSQVIYVWFDALCNYITALGYAVNSPLYRAWWEDESTQIWHFIGKDITKFHCIYWPAMLLSAGVRLPNKIIIHGFITIEGQKMSKSVGNVIDPVELAKQFGVETIRYYLLKEFSLAQDGDLTIANIKERYDKELANGLGNLLNRVVALIEKQGGKIKIESNLLKNDIDEAWQKYDEAMLDFRFNQAAEAFLQLISKADAFINQTRVWAIEEEQKKNETLSSLWMILINLSDLISPYLPETAIKIKNSLGANNEVNFLGKEFIVKRIPPLFPRLN